MELLPRREQEIFETLKKLQHSRFVIIGGYAVNAYTLPRFSVDCDLVIEDQKEQEKIIAGLEQEGYVKEELINPKFPYHGSFVRYVKELSSDFKRSESVSMKVSMDLLFGEVVDRRTQVGFTAPWVFNHAELKTLKGKTITEAIKLLIINPEALLVMKFLSCRINDIRDIFMLAPLVKNKTWIQEEIAERVNFQTHFRKITEKIQSPEFKNNLQGVYGYIDQKTFEKHQQAILMLEQPPK